MGASFFFFFWGGGGGRASSMLSHVIISEFKKFKKFLQEVEQDVYLLTFSMAALTSSGRGPEFPIHVMQPKPTM